MRTSWYATEKKFLNTKLMAGIYILCALHLKYVNLIYNIFFYERVYPLAQRLAYYYAVYAQSLIELVARLDFSVLLLNFRIHAYVNNNKYLSKLL